jgi:oxygen-dependent protoporphyrinogen oxidase
MSARRRVAVIGGGVTGLTAALALIERPGDELDVALYEARSLVGGHAHTRHEDGFRIESGPNGFLENDASRTVLQWLALEARAIEANRASSRRYIVRESRLRAVPRSPFGLLFGDALSPPGRLRVLREPWVRSRSVPRESVYEFARRRIGSEAARVLVDAAIGGITAGDSRTLEVDAAFPALVEMEREHGSLVRAMMQRARAARARRSPRAPKPRLVSFPGGVSDLIAAFEHRLGTRLRTDTPVLALGRDGRRWRLTCANGSEAEADAVLVATQARGAASLLSSFDAALAGQLAGIRFSGVGVVALAYREQDLPRPLEGYGFLIPSSERGRTLGAVWESSLYAGRAPAGYALIRAMIGGAREPLAIEESDDSLAARAREDLARFMGLRAEPARLWISRAPEAIAQYTDGHAERLGRLRAASARHPGLVLCGTSYEGVSMGAAMAAGLRAADAVLESSSAMRESA